MNLLLTAGKMALVLSFLWSKNTFLSFFFLHLKKKNKKNNKRFNSHGYLLFFFMGTFLKHLWLIPNILLKWRNCKIFTKLVPSQMPSRSSHQRFSVKEDILKTLQNFTGKDLHWSLFQTLFKRDSNTGVFQWNLQSFYEHLFWTMSANDCFCPY